jgi:hypothetical protein
VTTAQELVRDIRALFPVTGHHWDRRESPGALSQVVNKAIAVERWLNPRGAECLDAIYKEAEEADLVRTQQSKSKPRARKQAPWRPKGPLPDTSPARLVADHVIGPAVAWRELWPAVDGVMRAYDAIITHYGWVERVAGWPGPPAFRKLPETNPKTDDPIAAKKHDKEWAEWWADFRKAETRRQKKSWGWAWPDVPTIQPELLEALERAAGYLASLVDPEIATLSETALADIQSGVKRLRGKATVSSTANDPPIQPTAGEQSTASAVAPPDALRASEFRLGEHVIRDLTRTERDLLACYWGSGKLPEVGKRKIREEVYGPDSRVKDATIESHRKNLKRKVLLGSEGRWDIRQCAYGTGQHQLVNQQENRVET